MSKKKFKKIVVWEDFFPDDPTQKISLWIMLFIPFFNTIIILLYLIFRRKEVHWEEIK